MVPSTADRVAQNTSDATNQKIGADIRDSIQWHAQHPEVISARLRELDTEWDIERTLEANASTLAFTGVVLGATVDRRWLALPALVTAFRFSTRFRDGVRPCRSCAGWASARRARSTRSVRP